MLAGFDVDDVRLVFRDNGLCFNCFCELLLKLRGFMVQLAIFVAVYGGLWGYSLPRSCLFRDFLRICC